MTEHDRDNLDFLLKCSDEGFKEWFEQASDDDKLYASELLNEYEEELRAKLFQHTSAGHTVH